jgi:hypothetical protein
MGKTILPRMDTNTHEWENIRNANELAPASWSAPVLRRFGTIARHGNGGRGLPQSKTLRQLD